MRRIVAGALLALLALVSADRAADGQQRAFAHVTTLQPQQKALTVRTATMADLNGDGLADLLVNLLDRKRSQRWLHVHLRRTKGPAFGPEPDRTLRLKQDVVACATGDFTTAPGDEVVLLARRGAWVWRHDQPDAERYARLLKAEFLWQLPDAKEVFFWPEAVRDVDGDGLDDLTIPEPAGFLISTQRRAEGAAVGKFESAYRPRVPGRWQTGRATGRQKGKKARQELRVRFAVGDADVKSSSDMLTVSETVPAPHWIDFDGDGNLDLLAQNRTHLNVWLQTRRGVFSADPDSRHELPVEVDRKRKLDVSFSSWARHLDRDRRADCVFFAGDQRSDDIRTQILVFRQAGGKSKSADSPLFGPKGVPDQLLVLAGFAGGPRIQDVDGDGAQDIIVGTLRADTLDTLRAAASGSLDIEFHVFLNKRGTFSRTPDLRHGLTVKAKGLRRSDQRKAARFLGDVTGDGVSDLLLREDPEELRLLMTRKDAGGLSILERPLWTSRVDEDSVVHVHHQDGEPPELIVIGDRQVLHVRFGR